MHGGYRCVLAAAFLLLCPWTVFAQVVGRVPGGILSGDGQYIASNVTGPNACGPLDHAVLYHRGTRATECLGIATDGSLANASVVVTSLNPSGRFVVVESRATNLDSRCSNGVQHVFLLDRLSRTMVCVSYSSRKGEANGSSFGGFVNETGRAVAFTSEATNFAAPTDTNGVSDVFWRDPSDQVMLVSYGPGVANGSSVACGISGLAVLYQSAASNLVPDDTNGVGDLFVGEQTQATIRVSVGSSGQQSDADTSCDGATIKNSRTIRTINPGQWYMIGWGYTVAFTSGATTLLGAGMDTNGVSDVFLHRLDRISFPFSVVRKTVRVSVGAGSAQSNAESGGPSISVDGRFTAFASRASNLVGADTNDRWDVFVHDALLGTTRRLSGVTDLAIEGNGDSGVGPALRPATSISADGRFVAFYTAASNLSPDGPMPAHVIAINPNGTNGLVTGAGAGGGPHVRGFDARSEASFELVADSVLQLRGTRVALGDLDGDGAPEIVSAAGFGSPLGYYVAVKSSTMATVFPAYDTRLRTGLYVATGDVNGDGLAEIITGAGEGAGPHVRVLGASTFSDNGGFLAYDPAFAGGVRVAAGDVDGDGRAEVITSAGPGGGPHVRVFKWNPTTLGFSELAGFFAYSPGFAGGVYVAAGDINGDGRAEIVTGAGEGGGPHVMAFDLSHPSVIGIVASFFAYDPGFGGGVRVGTSDWDGDGRAEISTGPGPGGGPHVRVLKVGAGNVVTPLADFFAYDPAFAGGVYVAGPP